MHHAPPADFSASSSQRSPEWRWDERMGWLAGGLGGVAGGGRDFGESWEQTGGGVDARGSTSTPAPQWGAVRRGEKEGVWAKGCVTHAPPLPPNTEDFDAPPPPTHAPPPRLRRGGYTRGAPGGEAWHRAFGFRLWPQHPHTHTHTHRPMEYFGTRVQGAELPLRVCVCVCV